MFTVRMVMPWPGHLRADRERDALVGLDAHDEHVRAAGRSRAVSSKSGCGARLNWIAISVARLRQPLARAEVERRVGPAPVVDVELRGDERLGHRVGRDALLLAVARHLARPRRARPYWPRTTCFGPGVCERARSTFTFSLRTASAVEAIGRLHRGQRERAASCGSGPCRGSRRPARSNAPRPSMPDRLGHGDLHVVDVLAVPDAARRCRWRSGRPGCSAPSPCRGSGRCGRSASSKYSRDRGSARARARDRGRTASRR